MIAGVLNHLWQSTLFVLIAALLTLALRTNHAGARYSIWLAASLKFLLPFSVLISLGGHLGWLTGATAAPQWIIIVRTIAQPASIPNFFPTPRALPPSLPYIGYLLAAGWLVGFMAVVKRWADQWRQIKSYLHSAHRIDVGSSIETRASASILEPGVIGIRHPVLLLPLDLAQRLPPEQMRAITAHETSHVRRCDNLTSALHMLVEALFWFYPLVWWLGARLIAERERACDEAVIQAGNEPQVYAQAILNVCKHYVASPLICASGVSGADLTQRIRLIVANRVGVRLSAAKTLLVAVAGSVAIAAPILFGLFQSRMAHAQADSGFIARGDIKVSGSSNAEPVFNIDASSVNTTGNSMTLFEGMKLRTGNVTLMADRAVLSRKPNGDLVYIGWTLSGNVELHLPQGDLYADHATLHFKRKRHVLSLVTANGSWVASATESNGKTNVRDGALEVQYDIPNNAVEIVSPQSNE
jgi:beta-lactamase regulating signal transducer with metallopeptidase domain